MPTAHLSRFPEELDRRVQSRPSPTQHRLSAHFFSLSHRTTRLPDGKPITLPKSALARLVRCFARRGACGRVIPTCDVIGERLIELILLDTIALADCRRAQVLERYIERTMPPRVYDAVMARYSAESDALRDDANLPGWCLIQAAAMSSGWKTKTIARLVLVARAGRRVTVAELREVAALAQAIRAEDECRRLFRRRFGVDPYPCDLDARTQETCVPGGKHN